MKRDLKGMGKQNATQADKEAMVRSAMETADPQQLKNMEDAVNYYGNKSEDELMQELLRGKSSGLIDEARLNDVAARIAPMLTQDQLARLNSVIERLR